MLIIRGELWTLYDDRLGTETPLFHNKTQDLPYTAAALNEFGYLLTMSNGDKYVLDLQKKTLQDLPGLPAAGWQIMPNLSHRGEVVYKYAGG